MRATVLRLQIFIIIILHTTLVLVINKATCLVSRTTKKTGNRQMPFNAFANVHWLVQAGHLFQSFPLKQNHPSAS
jgi:hypothetical protein